MDYIIRPSQLARWMQCEKRALHQFHYPNDNERVVHVAQWVGSAVHAMCNDEEMPEFPKNKYVRYDYITPTRINALNTAHLMYAKLRNVAEKNNIDVISREDRTMKMRLETWPLNVYMQGTIDISGLKMPNFEITIIDIKTGEDFHAAWLQLGAYAAVLDHWNSPQVDLLAVIHLKRKDLLLPDYEPQIYFNNAEKCKELAMKSVDRIIDLIHSESDSATACPGLHCNSCNVPECAIRAYDFNPRQKTSTR